MQRPVGFRAVCFRLAAAQLLLVFVIVALTAAAIVGVTDEWQIVVLLGATLSLSALIGLWSGLSKAAILQRVGGAVLGGLLLTATLAAAFRMAPGAEWIQAAVFSMAPLMAVGMFAATLRWRGFGVERLDLDERKHDQRGVQFSFSSSKFAN